MRTDKPLLPHSKSNNIYKDGSPGSPTSSLSGSLPNPVSKLFKRKRMFGVLICLVYLIYVFFQDVERYSNHFNSKVELVGDKFNKLRTSSKSKSKSIAVTIKDSSLHQQQNNINNHEITTTATIPPIPTKPAGEVAPIEIPLIVKEEEDKEIHKASIYDQIKALPSFTRTEPITEPTTDLGIAADIVFKLGTTSPASYQLQLESFIRTSFPLSDSNESNPHSLINAMRSFFPLPSDQASGKFGIKGPIVYPSIPNIIFQTAASIKDEETQLDKIKSWETLHPDWNITFHDNRRASEWVRERFAIERVGSSNLTPEEEEESDRGIVGAWNRLKSPAVLRSDFWRYLVVCSEGGVYADTDVEALKKVDVWGLDPSWEGLIAKDYVPPSFIAGVEADVGGRHDWALWYPRPLEISQWTFASARGHPILIDAIRRVVQDAFSGNPDEPLSVVERTGPGPFTDSVFRYLKMKYDKPWKDFRALGEDGWRYFDKERRWGDIKILSITGFSPGAGHMGSGEPTDRQAMSQHWFAGSWKGQEGSQGTQNKQ